MLSQSRKRYHDGHPLPHSYSLLLCNNNKWQNMVGRRCIRPGKKVEHVFLIGYSCSYHEVTGNRQEGGGGDIHRRVLKEKEREKDKES